MEKEKAVLFNIGQLVLVNLLPSVVVKANTGAFEIIIMDLL